MTALYRIPAKEAFGARPEKVVLSGVSFEKGRLGAAAYDRETENISYYFAEQIEGYYHGTGDVFGSALIAAVMNGFSLAEATLDRVLIHGRRYPPHKAAGTDIRYGVDFENEIPGLLRLLGKIQ